MQNVDFFPKKQPFLSFFRPTALQKVSKKYLLFLQLRVSLFEYAVYSPLFREFGVWAGIRPMSIILGGGAAQFSGIMGAVETVLAP